MTRAVRHVLLAMILATISVAVTPAAGEPEVAGVYIASGLNPDGSQYRGVVHIARLGQSVVVRWIFSRVPARPSTARSR